ncbi:D-glycero-alpha-D-manno-heptose-1,7-bisphosphate 7-phosphatase [Candidatus Omnitrophota bacterium]
MSRGIVFIDRDGVINKFPGHGEYVLSKEALEVFPYVIESLKSLKEKGFLIYIISNQACVAKGLISEDHLKEMTKDMLSRIEAEGKLIDGVHYCIHSQEEDCPYRKPNAGMIQEVFKQAGLDAASARSQSYFIGDSIRDVQAAQAAELKSILVLSGKETIEQRDSWEARPDFIFNNLKDAVDFILRFVP